MMECIGSLTGDIPLNALESREDNSHTTRLRGIPSTNLVILHT